MKQRRLIPPGAGLVSGLLFWAMAAALPAWSGVVIEQEVKNAVSGGATRLITYVEPGRLRMEMQSGTDSAIIIFRADRQVVWMIQPGKKTYREMTQADVERISGQMAGLRQQQEEMLKQLPAEQREMVEKMLKQQGGGPLNVEVKALGPDPVGGFATTKYDILVNGERSSTLWAAPLEQLRLTAQEYDTFLQFARFFERLSEGLGGEGSAANLLARYAEQIQGFPVKVVSFEEGEITSEQQTVRAERQTIGDDRFELPPGLRKLELDQPEP